jgi:hypothetical protein
MFCKIIHLRMQAVQASPVFDAALWVETLQFGHYPALARGGQGVELKQGGVACKTAAVAYARGFRDLSPANVLKSGQPRAV